MELCARKGENSYSLITFSPAYLYLRNKVHVEREKKVCTQIVCLREREREIKIKLYHEHARTWITDVFPRI